MGAEFHAGGHTDTTKLIVTSRSSAKALHNWRNSTHLVRANYWTDDRYICRTTQLLVKGKVLPITGHEGREEERRGIALLFLYNLGAIWGWVDNATPRPARFASGKEIRYPLHGRLGGRQGWSGRVRKASPPYRPYRGTILGLDLRNFIRGWESNTALATVVVLNKNSGI
jgi:hypothetical protein